ncbi:MAG TPA: hypothetical protein VF159_02495 [Gemmatimonadaceae bacterium]
MATGAVTGRGAEVVAHAPAMAKSTADAVTRSAAGDGKRMIGDQVGTWGARPWWVGALLEYARR